jgi:hypothetical protein
MSDSEAPPSGGRRRFDDCTEVSAFCPVEATVLGYYPNFGASIFFAIAFGILLIAALYLSIWKRTWTYGAAICVGLLLELCGYVGRALLHKNPWDKDAFQMQICTIILGPTFICVSVYLTLKHIALNLNPGISRLAPRWYPRIFLPADLSCLIVQAIGGGIAAAAGTTNRALAQGGNRAIIAGVVLQVVVLIIFGVMGTDYYLRLRKYLRSPDADPAAVALWNDRKFGFFVKGVTGAFATILVRCIYRVVEMSGGWGNHIMQDEISFTILDSTLVLIATTLLTVVHPGLMFPQMANRRSSKKKNADMAAVETGESSNEGVRTEKV